MTLDKYRIRRVGPRNLTIQRNIGNEWRTISYHGNSLNSLISGLFALIVAQCTPEHDSIYDTLEGLELEMIKGLDAIRKMVERDCREL